MRESSRVSNPPKRRSVWIVGIVIVVFGLFGTALNGAVFHAVFGSTVTHVKPTSCPSGEPRCTPPTTPRIALRHYRHGDYGHVNSRYLYRHLTTHNKRHMAKLYRKAYKAYVRAHAIAAEQGRALPGLWRPHWSTFKSFMFHSQKYSPCFADYRSAEVCQPNVALSHMNKVVNRQMGNASKAELACGGNALEATWAAARGSRWLGEAAYPNGLRAGLGTFALCNVHSLLHAAWGWFK